MNYIENPKTKGSGILCVIPQYHKCPIGCEDCFFQSGRSYLEPLEKNLPNIPPTDNYHLFRINDGNDSNNKRDQVMYVASRYPQRFYNTSIPKDLDFFDAPVVLTVNPGTMTDTDFFRLEHIPKNLMFVRIRTNTWNIDKVVCPAVNYYSSCSVPVVLTFMAYYKNQVPEKYVEDYIWRKRTLNSYWAITNFSWKKIMGIFNDNRLVHSCGKIEGEEGDTHCKFCGNCLREYFATMERMR